MYFLNQTSEYRHSDRKDVKFYGLKFLMRKYIMPRKRLAKNTAKKSQKTQQSGKFMPEFELMEQAFWKVPTALVAQLSKEIKVLRQREKQLVKVLKKTNAQLNKDKSRLLAATKSKSKVAKKKLLVAAKEAHQKTNATIKELSVKLAEIQKSAQSFIEKQLKLSALGKIISQFNKQWTNKPIAKKKPAVKRKPKVVTSQPTFEPTTQSSLPTMIENSPMETSSEEMENISSNL